MIIPYDKLPVDTLQSLLEEYISREGTDYGETEMSLEEKVVLAKASLLHGDTVIVFDSQSETATILTVAEASQRQQQYADAALYPDEKPSVERQNFAPRSIQPNSRQSNAEDYSDYIPDYD